MARITSLEEARQFDRQAHAIALKMAHRFYIHHRDNKAAKSQFNILEQRVRSGSGGTASLASSASLSDDEGSASAVAIAALAPSTPASDDEAIFTSPSAMIANPSTFPASEGEAICVENPPTLHMDDGEAKGPDYLSGAAATSPKRRHRKRSFTQLSAEEAAFNAFVYFYRLLAMNTKILPFRNAAALKVKLDTLGNTPFVHDALHPPHVDYDTGFVSFDHMHKQEMPAQRRAADLALEAYNLALEVAQHRMRIAHYSSEKAFQQQRLLALHEHKRQAENIANAIRDGYTKTLHRNYVCHYPLTGTRFEFSRQLERQRFKQLRNEQFVKATWNAGFKASAPLAAVAAFVAYAIPMTYYTLRYGRKRKAIWHKMRARRNAVSKTWARNAAQAVRTVGAVVMFALAAVPVLIQQSTRQVSLDKSDDLLQRIYDIYHVVTDDRGNILPEQEHNVHGLIRFILHHYTANLVTSSDSSRQLLEQLKSKTLSLGEKLQAIVGYMVDERTHYKQRDGLRGMLWGRDVRAEKLISTKGDHNYNAGKKLHNVIVDGLSEMSLKPRAIIKPTATPIAATHSSIGRRWVS